MSKKNIATPADLAINGALPTFEQPLHVGRPNVGDKAVFQALVDDMFERRWFSNNGPILQEFENRVAAYLGVKHCVAMCNGTIALEIAIRALELTGEVIVPSYTFVATAHALHWQGITPVFADIDPSTHNIDPVAVRRMITPRTTGIIGVHLWGRAAPVEQLQEIADEHGLALMFDAAHAFGCTHAGRKIGGFGRCEVLSFHATKFFNTFEGGAVVTDDDDLASKMRLMRNFGFAGYDNVVHPGTNGKMVEICAAMGIANLEKVDDVIAGNARTHAEYVQALDTLEGVRVLPFDPNESNNFQYVVVELFGTTAQLRDALVGALQAENILARKYFWPGVHRMAPYRDLFPHAGLVLPVSEDVADRVIVMPGGPSVESDVIATIRQVMSVVIQGDLTSKLMALA